MKTMETLYFIMLLAGVLSFALAAAKIEHARLNLVALGLLFWLGVVAIQAGRAL